MSKLGVLCACNFELYIKLSLLHDSVFDSCL